MIFKRISADKLSNSRKKSDQPGSIVLSYTASTPKPDRFGDVINQAGWDLSSYSKNPIVLFQHRADQLPIGKGSVRMYQGKLLIDIEFDTDERSAEIARKAQKGFLNAVSVGFNALEAYQRKDLEESHFAHGSKGTYFDKAELLEVSLVTIPANGGAVQSKDLSFVQGLTSVMKEQLRDIIKSELLARPFQGMDLFYMYKHILEIEELEDRYILHVAKEKDMSEIEEEIEEETEDFESFYEEEEELKTKAAADRKIVPFQDLPITDEPYNLSELPDPDIQDSILADGDWDRYKKAHLVWTPDNAEIKGGYAFPIARLRDPDDPENSAPEKGTLTVYRSKLADAMAALNGARGQKPDLTESQRQAMYKHLSKYYEELDEEAPNLKTKHLFDYLTDEDWSEIITTI